MIHSAFDPMDIAGLHQWMQQQAGDNSQRRQRLLHNFSRNVHLIHICIGFLWH